MIMIPRFIRFYGGYKASDVLDEYARTFFAMLNQMIRIEAQERIYSIIDNASAYGGGDDAERHMKELKDQYDGPDKFIREAKVLKGVRNV